jgi:Druantia protein DruA
VLEAETIQGRRIGGGEIAEIRELIEKNPAWSRRRLSEVLAERWQWYGASGQLKDMAARTLLLKLQDRGLIELPPRRQAPPARRGVDGEPDLFEGLPLAPVVAGLSSLRPLQIQVLSPKDRDYRLFQRYLRQHHYLGHRGPVGENLAYLIRSRAGVELACLLFGAAAWQCAPRDRWIGWSADQRAQGLSFIANNSRFLILPSVVVPHLASHLLAQVARRIDGDWQRRYGHPIHLLETFVQQDRFGGACYEAANWIKVGQTTGRTRQSQRHRDNAVHAPVKDIYLYPLASNARCNLCR